MNILEKYQPIELTSFCNNYGIFSNSVDAAFDTWGCTFPPELLPVGEKKTILNHVDFIFPHQDIPNNMTLQNQYISFDAKRYDFIHVLGASDGGSFKENIFLHYDGEDVETVSLGLTWWKAPAPLFENKLALRCDYIINAYRKKNQAIKPALWYHMLKLKNERPLTAIRFPDNICMHVFAITLEVAV